MAKRERGFTAPELVVTVAVVGILSSLALQQGGGPWPGCGWRV